ncbi:TPA: DNA-directed RNA polymerase subunit omega [Clostridium perfringens]
MNNSMINPSIVELLKRVEDRYSLVILSAKRARQIIDGAETFVDVESNKPLTIAINEIDQGFVHYKDAEEK